jgi:hypothetical protein
LRVFLSLYYPAGFIYASRFRRQQTPKKEALFVGVFGMFLHWHILGLFAGAFIHPFIHEPFIPDRQIKSHWLFIYAVIHWQLLVRYWFSYSLLIIYLLARRKSLLNGGNRWMGDSPTLHIRQHYQRSDNNPLRGGTNRKV